MSQYGILCECHSVVFYVNVTVWYFMSSQSVVFYVECHSMVFYVECHSMVFYVNVTVGYFM